MLIGFLPDTRGVIGLGILRSRRAEPELTQMFESEQQAQREAEAASDEPWPTDQLVYLAKALWQIRPDRRWLDAILGVLASGDEWQRQMAVEELRGRRVCAITVTCQRGSRHSTIPNRLVRHARTAFAGRFR